MMKLKGLVVLIVCVVLIVLAIVASVVLHGSDKPVVGAAENTQDSNLEQGVQDSVRETRYSSLRSHHIAEVQAVLKKHYPVARHIIDATAHVGGDTINFMKTYPEATVTAIEVKPATFRALLNNIGAAEKEQGRPEGSVRLVNMNCIKFLQETTEKADFVYLDPPWGGPKYSRECRLNLYLTDPEGKRWDVSKVVNLVFSRGISSSVVLKAPFNFKTSDFSSRVDVPLTVHPIGQSKTRDSDVSYWLLIVGKGMQGKY